SSRSRNQKPFCAWKNTSPNGEVNRGCLPWISAQSQDSSARANWSAEKDRVGSISALRAQLARLAFRAAGQLLRCATRADLGLHRGELAVHVRAGPGLVQFLLC